MTPDLLFFLTDKDGRSYRVNKGTVEVVGTPTPLSDGPDGWDDTAVKYGRNSRYFGLFRTFTTPLKFVGDGATILRNHLYQYGTEGEMFLSILKLDKSFGGGWVHRPFYRGEIDFSKAEDSEFVVTVNVMEGGLDKLLAANESTQYTLNMDKAVQVRMDGLELHQSAEFFISNGFVTQNNGNHCVDLMLLGQEGATLNVKSVERENLGDNQNVALERDLKWFYNPTTQNPVKISWDFTVACTLASGISPNPGVKLFLACRILKDGGLIDKIGPILQEFDGPTNVYRSNHFQGEATIDLSGITLGQGKLYLFLGINAVGSSGDQSTFFQYGDDGSFKITDAIYKHPTSLVKALRPKDAAQQLLDQITGGGYTVESTLFDTAWKDLCITSGDALRLLTGATIKTSWNDFFHSYNVPCNIEMTIAGTVLHIEAKQTAYQPTVLADLGTVNEASIKPADDYLYSSVKVGYPDVTIEDLNGKDEFNVTQQWTGPVVRVVKELDLTSSYKASMYDIEFTRINTEGKDTTNNKNDNSVFFLHIGGVEHEVVLTVALIGLVHTGVKYYELRRDFTAIAGVRAGATAFNTAISPRQCLENHSAYLSGCFYFQPGGALKFQSTQRNADMVLTYGPKVIKENGPLAFSGAYFIPIEIEFKSPMPAGLTDIMAGNPQGCFIFTWDGVTFSGYPLEVGIKPADRAAQQSRLLLTATNDLTKLIR